MKHNGYEIVNEALISLDPNTMKKMSKTSNQLKSLSNLFTTGASRKLTPGERTRTLLLARKIKRGSIDGYPANQLAGVLQGK